MANNRFNVRVKLTPQQANIAVAGFNTELKKMEGMLKPVKVNIKIGNYGQFKRQISTLRGELKTLQNVSIDTSINPLKQPNNSKNNLKNNNSDLMKWSANIEKTKTKVTGLINELNDAQTAYVKFATKKVNQNGGQNFNEHLANLKQYRQELLILDKSSPDFKDRYQTIKQNISIEESWIQSLKKEHALNVRNNKEFDKYNSTLRDATGDMNKYAAELKKIGLYSQYESLQQNIVSRQISTDEATKELARLREQLHLAGIDIDTTWGKLKRLFKDKWQPILATQSWYFIFNSLGQIYQNVVQIDTAMTELRKVTDATSKEYIQFLDDAETRARRLGATLVETVNATSDFARLGYSISESSNLADAALTYLNVGDKKFMSSLIVI